MSLLLFPFLPAHMQDRCLSCPVKSAAPRSLGPRNRPTSMKGTRWLVSDNLVALGSACGG